MENQAENIKKKGEFWRFLKFVMFSVSAGVIEIVSYSLLTELTPLPDWACYLTGLVLSVLWNFTLNRKFTFKSANNVPKAMLLVFLFYLVFTPATTLLESFLTDTAHWNGYLVTAINMGLNFVLEYFYDRFVVFRKSIDTNELAAKQAEKEEN